MIVFSWRRNFYFGYRWQQYFTESSGKKNIPNISRAVPGIENRIGILFADRKINIPVLFAVINFDSFGVFQNVLIMDLVIKIIRKINACQPIIIVKPTERNRIHRIVISQIFIVADDKQLFPKNCMIS